MAESRSPFHPIDRHLIRVCVLLLVATTLAPAIARAERALSAPGPGDSLLLYLDFEGDLSDESGNMHDGIAGGTLTYAPGVGGGMAASFSGDDSVTFPSVPDSAFTTNDFSVAYWFDTPIDRPASYTGKLEICNVSPSFENKSGEGGEVIAAGIADDSAFYAVRTARATGWQHLAFVRRATSIALYLNGELRDHLEVPPIDIEGAAVLGISTSPCIGIDGTLTLVGELDDLRIYERALTGTEVASFIPGLVFRDGFESGGTEAWASSPP